ncbi:hypothetical protein SRA_01292 [Streptococcus ratti FA-1 = DSM 20564]|uniref:Uncharacterized protein n=1 Tax=Streptococcus ratti FA-1 = DSM 20564 TaxID=699248 RepID=A0ABN0GXD0_STRRT|nr:hypothetical protein SRA_01292 [Streptococcus ratti FA-1 = DSM 20564]
MLHPIAVSLENSLGVRLLLPQKIQLSSADNKTVKIFR